MDGLSRHAATLGVPVEKRLQILALHEIVHFERSMGALFPKGSQAKYQRTIEGGLRHMKPSEKTALAKLYGFDTATGEGKAKLAEEYLARVSETAGRPPEWAARVIAQIRELLRAVLPEMAWTDGDILALLDGARRRANASAGA